MEKEESNRLLNYAVSLSKYSGAELLILLILQDMKKMGNVSVQGSNEDKKDHKDMKREIKGEIIDEMEILKNCIIQCKADVMDVDQKTLSYNKRTFKDKTKTFVIIVLTNE
jgi:hypothetical protein